MTDILHSYSFQVVSLGTFILAFSSGMIGSISVLKGQSLIGDAIGHAAYPGIILAFMLSLQRDPVVLLLGAIISGGLAFSSIQVVKANSKLDLDAILAVVLSSFFGLGMVLKSYVQGNPKFSGGSQSGLANYIFGQAAYIMRSDVRVILAVSFIALSLLLIFYKELKLFVFDEIYARAVGINTRLCQTILLVMMMSLIAVGLKLVGAILISSLLIVPAITALQWSNRFHIVLLLSGFVGGVSALAGTFISTVVSGMSTGPTIILVMSLLAFLSLVFGPHGVVSNIKMRRAYRD